MERADKKKLIENALRYAAYFLAFLVTPFLAAVVGEWFVWVGYGRMTPFFTNIFTMIFWLLEFIVLLIVDTVLKRQRAKKETAEEKQLTLEELALEPSAEEKPKKKRTPPLPLKNLFVLTAIVALCVLFISAQIDFKVKPFYEIGEKINGYEFWNKISGFTCNMVKCVWIVLFMGVALEFFKTLFAEIPNEKQKRGAIWFAVIVAILPFALYDVLISGMSLAFGLTYLFLFYPAFVLVYYFTEQRGVQAYLLIMFIYIF